MEMIRKAPGTIMVSSARVFVRSTLWFLNAVQSAITRVAPSVPNLREEKLNFSLAFPNGKTQEIVVSKNNYDSYESKRMKLVLDISVLPDDNYQVVSAQNLPRSDFRTPQRWMDTLTYYVLQSIKISEQIINEVENLIDSSTGASSEARGNGTAEDRKWKSPRKRLPESKVRPFRRFLSRVWGILGFGQEENVLFDPVPANGDASFNTSFSALNGKHEKRKHPEDSDSEGSANEEDTLPLVNGSLQSPQPQTESNIEVPEQDEQASNSASESDESPQADEAKPNYLEVEEDYESADDPDYVPSSESPSLSSDSIQSDDEQLDHLKEELTHLQKESQDPVISP